MTVKIPKGSTVDRCDNCLFASDINPLTGYTDAQNDACTKFDCTDRIVVRESDAEWIIGEVIAAKLGA